jgi:hypothetical protein
MLDATTNINERQTPATDCDCRTRLMTGTAD